MYVLIWILAAAIVSDMLSLGPAHGQRVIVIRVDQGSVYSQLCTRECWGGTENAVSTIL